MAGELDNLTAQVNEIKGVAESAGALLAGLHQMLLDAIASGDPAQIQALADNLGATKVALAAAVAANPLPTP